MNFLKTHKIKKNKNSHQVYKFTRKNKLFTWSSLTAVIAFILLVITFGLILNNEIDKTLSRNLSDEENNLSEQQDVLKKSESVFDESVRESDIIESDDYFNDVVFIGDSVTSGIQLYKAAKNAVIISKTGLNIMNIINDKIKFNDQEMTVLDAVKQSGRKKIYIMIGSNGIGWLDDDYMIGLYRDWLNQLRSEIEDSVIFVQSVLPITKELSDIHSSKKEALTNEKIDIYNNKLLKMCSEKKFYYLNVAEKFRDENNALPDDASPVDGMHISADYYNIWLNYIKSHTVKT